MGSTSVHHFAKTKLGIKTYQNAPGIPHQVRYSILHQTDYSPIRHSECVNLIITGDIDTPTDAPPSNLVFPPTPQARYGPVAMTRLVLSAILKRNCTLMGNSGRAG